MGWSWRCERAAPGTRLGAVARSFGGHGAPRRAVPLNDTLALVAAVDGIARVVMEVIDLAGPGVIAHQSFDNPSLLFLEGTTMPYSASQSESGYVTMDPWRARITNP